MSERTYAHVDNQFIAIRPLRARASTTAFRTDYSSTLTNLRRPAARPKQYANNFNTRRPISKSVTEPNVSLKQHQTHTPLMSQEFFQSVLEASGTPQVKNGSRHHSFKLRRPRLNKVQMALISLAILFLGLGSYFSIIGWHSSLVAKKQAANLTSLANELGNSTAGSKSTKNPALSTTPISSSALASYTVAPNLPRYLIIPKLSVDARVLSVGVTSSGAVGTPDNVYDTAWYNESAQPGQPGAMLIDGHVSSWTAHGVFYGIKTLLPGDTIQVERGDGTMFTYKVVKSQVYPSGNVNMNAAMTPVVAGQPGLNLITCTGDVIPGTSEFNERIVVFATQVS